MTPSSVRSLMRAGLAKYRLSRGPTSGRDTALVDEVAFWERWLARNHAELRSRLRSELTHETVRECLGEIDDSEASIIDVGSGPLTTLGTRLPGRTISLTAVDPLAAEYDSILERAGIDPPVRAMPCSGEELSERFEPQSFDLAFSENALDHAVDPVPIIRSMIELVKPGRYVVLDHQCNEGLHAAYGQLHHWNFDERDGRCLIWRGADERDLGAEVLDLATLEARRSRPPDKDRDRVICILRKHLSPSESARPGENAREPALHSS